MQQPVPALGQCVDDRRHPGHSHSQAGTERDLNLGDSRQPAIDVRVGADDVDLEAGNSALADLVERASHAVHAADAIGDQRHPHRRVRLRGQLSLLAPEEGGGRCVRDRRDAGVEQLDRRVAETDRPRPLRVRKRRRRRSQLGDGGRQLALVGAPGSALQPRVRELVGLEKRDQPAVG